MAEGNTQLVMLKAKKHIAGEAFQNALYLCDT